MKDGQTVRSSYVRIRSLMIGMFAWVFTVINVSGIFIENIEFDKHPVSLGQKSLMTVTVRNGDPYPKTITLNIMAKDLEMFPNSTATARLESELFFSTSEKKFGFALTPQDAGSIPISVELVEDGNVVDSKTLLFEVLAADQPVKSEPVEIIDEMKRSNGKDFDYMGIITIALAVLPAIGSLVAIKSYLERRKAKRKARMSEGE